MTRHDVCDVLCVLWSTVWTWWLELELLEAWKWCWLISGLYWCPHQFSPGGRNSTPSTGGSEGDAHTTGLAQISGTILWMLLYLDSLLSDQANLQEITGTSSTHLFNLNTIYHAIWVEIRKKQIYLVVELKVLGTLTLGSKKGQKKQSWLK